MITSTEVNYRLEQRRRDVRPYPPMKGVGQNYAVIRIRVRDIVNAFQPFDFLVQASLLERVFIHHEVMREGKGKGKSNPLNRAAALAYDRNNRLNTGNLILTHYWLMAIWPGLVPSDPNEPPTRSLLPLDQLGDPR